MTVLLGHNLIDMVQVYNLIHKFITFNKKKGQRFDFVEGVCKLKKNLIRVDICLLINDSYVLMIILDEKLLKYGQQIGMLPLQLKTCSLVPSFHR